MGIAFWGSPTPDAVTINGEDFIDDHGQGGQIWFSSPVDLAPGVNRVRLAVEYQGRIIEEAVIPITYVAGAEEWIGWIAAATDDSITVDLAEWNDNQEFPGPEDPDPGVLVVLPIDGQVRVVVDAEVEVGYEWLEAEVNSGYTNLEGLAGFDDWNPAGVYPYVLTVRDGEVMQIWRIPLG